MFKKIITTLIVSVLCICMGSIYKVNAENLNEENNQTIQIENIPSIDPIVSKLKISNSEESILVEFNEITKEIKIDGTTYKPNWWPGNPNPQPGTEEYLYAQMQKNKDFNPSISTEIVRACAMEVSNNLAKIAVGTLFSFLKSGNYSLASFLAYTGFGFFTGMAKTYYGCIAKYIH